MREVDTAAIPGRSRAPASAPVATLLVMLGVVSPLGAVELERVLSSQLAIPAATPGEERVAQLQALTAALESELAISLPAHHLAPVQVKQVDYDRTRPAGAPSSEVLIGRYGGAEKNGWAWACRAAWGLLPDGRKTKPGLGWPSTLRGKRRLPRSERDHVIASIRACALALLRRPSSYIYIEWLTAQRRRARNAPAAPGAPGPRRLTGIAAVYQHFPHGWASALAAANITDEELSAERARLVAERAGDSPVFHPEVETAAQRLGGVSGEVLDALGMAPAMRDRLVRKGCGELPVSAAVALARSLGGSLDWLTALDVDPKEPPDAQARFDAEQLRSRAKLEGVRLDAIAARAKLDVSGWRAVVAGTREPTLGQLAKMAGAVRSSVGALCPPGGPASPEAAVHPPPRVFA